jgi:2-polyprenyl-3-methyl-5-hydroxy-6-metoxy-1,4-benzoquinol methylase
MSKQPTGHRLDKKWLYASAFDKWPFIIKHVDFRNKSFLDVGCNIGYSCFKAWSLMAKSVFGLDIRANILRIARKIKINQLKIKSDKEIKFRCGKWEDIKSFPQIDIIICMGLLHYFLIENYELILNKLMGFCKETLILELRLRQNNKEIKLTKGSGNQTLPTEGWLFKKLKDNGFTVKARLDRGKDRELWIAERGKQ